MVQRTVSAFPFSVEEAPVDTVASINACQYLRAEHRDIESLCARLAVAAVGARGAVASSLRRALEIHCQLEYDIFYPSLRGMPGLDDLLDRACDEHAEADAAVQQLEAMPPHDPDFPHCARLLTENLRQHFHDEEETLFTGARRAGVDLAGVGEELARRKAELVGQPGGLELAPAG